MVSKTLPLSLVFTFRTILIILGLIAFRLLWGHPAFRVMIHYFPESWQRWLLDEPRLPSKNTH
jgi:hypothetical protein